MKSLATLFALFSFLNLNAQWTTNTAENTLVAESEGGDMKAIGTSDGKTYVVFWKVVAPPTNYELRMQVLDTDGTQMLGPDGALVSDVIPMSTFTVIWNITVDTNDNLYIGVTGTGGGDPAFAFKLDEGGNHLWGSNGINVGSGNVVTVKPLSTGDAIVAWFEGPQAVMQKFNSSGTATWPSNQSVISGSNSTVPANMFELSGGDFIMVFHTILSGINSNLYAQRFDNDGNAVWGIPTQLSNQATAFNRSYTGIQDGDVVYMGYFASSGVRFDSFLQRINPDGTLPWGINGSDFDTNQTDYEMGTEIAFTQGSQHIWAICTYSNSSQSERGEYVQKFDKITGGRLLSDTAKEVYTIGSENVHAGLLHLKDESPLFLLKSGIDNGATPTTLGVVYLDENGDFVWPEESRPVATFPANKSRIHYTKPVNNQTVAVFIEDKGAGDKIYAQNFIDEVLSVEDVSEMKVFYANPVKDEMIVKAEFPVNSISVFNTLGQEIFNSEYNQNLQVTIPTQGWSTGMYFMNLEIAEGIKRGIKLIKE